MKHLAAAVLLTLAALALLFAPAARAQTRFTVTIEGQAGTSAKPDAPAILLLPGLTSGREVFDTEAAILAQTHRLYRVQLNGFAGQPAGPNASGAILDPVVEQLHQYILQNHLHPYVIGHSMGGLVGLMLAKAHPEDVRKLLVVDSLPFYALVFNPQATVATVEPQTKAMRDALLTTTAEAYAASAQRTATFLVNAPAGQKLVAAESIASDRRVTAQTMYEDMTTDLRPQLPTIKTPTVLLYPYDATLQGSNPAVVDTLYHSAYAGMPNLTFFRVDASRHFMQLDQPTVFDTQVQAFLR